MFLWDIMRKMNQAADYITRDSRQNVSSHGDDYDEEDVEDDLFLEELREIRMGFKSLYDAGITIIDPSKGRYSAEVILLRELHTILSITVMEAL